MRILLTVFLSLSMAVSYALPQYEREDSVTVMSLLDEAAAQPEGTNYMLFFARKLVGLPYVAHTLEVNDVERLVVNLRQVDCTTFTENVTALTLCVIGGEPSFEAFCRNLQSLRYYAGTEPQYVTRLHYFTSWIEDNTAEGICREITSDGAPFTATQRIEASYMTSHVDKYRMLAAHPQDIPLIREQEKSITGKTYRYIPQGQIDNSTLLRQTVHDGDIIAIVTNIAGLDTQHIGIAVWHDDGLHLLNASSIHKKVVEEPLTLRQYLERHKTMPGIRVVRINGNPDAGQAR